MQVVCVQPETGLTVNENYVQVIHGKEKGSESSSLDAPQEKAVHLFFSLSL